MTKNILTTVLVLMIASCVSNPVCKNKEKNKSSVMLNFQNLSWVWAPQDSPPNTSAQPGTCYFRKTFQVANPKAIKDAYITITSDDSNKVFLNGKNIGENNDWLEVKAYPLDKYLEQGINVIAIEAFNKGTAPNPAGLLGGIVITFTDDTLPIEIPIDSSWKVSKKSAANWKLAGFNDSKWQNANPFAKYGIDPWGVMPLPATIPGNFPEFIVPGAEKEMATVKELFLHHFPNSHNEMALWDCWLPMSVIWPATGIRNSNPKQIFYRNALSQKRISDKGYVSTQQHRGLGHPEGWPFPIWQQGFGIGWHFEMPPGIGVAYGIKTLTNVSNWKITGAKTLGINEKDGWQLKLTKADATIEPPKFSVANQVAPFFRLEWTMKSHAKAWTPTKPFLEWTSVKYPGFDSSQRVYFSAITPEDGQVFTMIPMYKSPLWTASDTVTAVRINFDNTPGTKINIQALFTAVDTRHNINNSSYLSGCADYINWTGDKCFLKENIEKMRLALNYMIEEFQIESNKFVFTPWIGHDGTSAIFYNEKGEKQIRHGHGIGSSYMDLLPAGGNDYQATIYAYNALKAMSKMEKEIENHPEWGISKKGKKFDSKKLSKLADEVKKTSQKTFWNEKTGRFVAAIDVNGKAYDFGYTLPNCESIYYGIASPKQEKSIMSWLDGKRIVKNDTSTGKDIYRFRFAPRATTLRNTNYYTYAWTGPESIPFGNQIQDGGAVLGFSFQDLMARLKSNGPDDAWLRLKEIIKWFDEVQDEGGYRKYYANDPKRGTMQGGGPPGGLGMDFEFVESILVPQVMLYGFMGFEPRIDGFAINPQLPKSWPKLTITQILFHNKPIKITVSKNKISIDISCRSKYLKVFPPKGKWTAKYFDKNGKKIKSEKFDVTEKKPGIPLGEKGSVRVELMVNG